MTNMHARISKTSVLTGKTRTMEFTKYSQEEFDRLLFAYQEGKFVSLNEAFPLLTEKAIEFIKNGTLPNEWDDNS